MMFTTCKTTFFHIFPHIFNFSASETGGCNSYGLPGGYPPAGLDENGVAVRTGMGLALTDLKAELALFFSGFSPHMVKTRQLSSK
jgi:hypothetical protein